MLDKNVIGNITASIVEGIFAATPDPQKMIASKIYGSVSMPTQVANIKIEMPVNQLDDSNGRANPGTKFVEPVFSDIKLTAKPVSTGLQFNEQDYVNYGFEKKIRQFIEQAATLPGAYDEEQLSRLLMGGLVNVTNFDSLSFFNAAHLVVPGQTRTFSNNLNAGLVAVTTANLTVPVVRTAVSSAVKAMRTIGFGNGFILDVMEPMALVCSAAAEQIATDALDSAFYAAGNGSQDNSGYRNRYKFPIFASAFIDAQIAYNTANGNPYSLPANAENAMYLIAKPRGDAAGLFTGTFFPFTMRDDLAALDSGSIATVYSRQFIGQVAYQYAFPHFAIRVY